MKECGVVNRLSDTVQNALINIVTIFLGLGVGSKMSAEKFLNPETMGILGLGAVAFCIGTASGVLMAKLMNLMSKREGQSFDWCGWRFCSSYGGSCGQ